MPRTRSGPGPRLHRPQQEPAPGRASRRRAVAGTLFVATFAFLGCASVLGIDNEYVLENSEISSGGTSSGGKAGGTFSGGSSQGGALSTGGTGTGSGASVADGAPDVRGCTEGGSDCPAGTKCCSGSCVVPAPLVGCEPDMCGQCDAPPAFGTIACVANECAVQCNPSYVLRGEVCEPQPSNTGGAPGAGGQPGAGGAAGACDPQKCGPCVPVGAFKCCKNNDECGCTWAPGAYCL